MNKNGNRSVSSLAGSRVTMAVTKARVRVRVRVSEGIEKEDEEASPNTTYDVPVKAPQQ